MSLSNTAVYALCAMLLIAVVGAWATQTMKNEIKIHYPDLYDYIGRPGLFSRRTIYDQCRFARFIFRREYNSLDSRRIKRLGNVVLLCNLINVMIFVYLFSFRYNDFRGWIE